MGIEEKGFLPKGIKSKKAQSAGVSTATHFLSVSVRGLKLGVPVESSGLAPHACLLPPSPLPGRRGSFWLLLCSVSAT